MSLAAAAHHIASKGRHGDTTLVHMAPQELAGLHALARAHGKKITTNPDTGLPEAFSLKSLLPMLAGAALTIGSGGTLTPLMAAGIVGGGTTLATGSLNKGLMAGLGAYGGAGLGAGVAEAGLSQAAVPGAAPVSPDAAAFPTNPAAYAEFAPKGNLPGAFGEVAVPAAPAEYAAFNANPQHFGAMGEAPTGVSEAATSTTYTPPSAVQTTPISTQAARTAAEEQYANMSAGERFSQAGKGLSGLMDSQGARNAFMDKVGGGMGLAQYAGAAAVPGLMEPRKQATYDGGGSNPYQYEYNANPTGATPGSPEPYYFRPSYRRLAAEGGIMALAGGGMSHLGDYSDGGRLLRGPGDGVSDDIPATIADKRPARLADGEFVVPARIVSELGNGSTEAGARKLYAMMDRVQQARGKTVGKGKVAVNSRADKLLPA